MQQRAKAGSRQRVEEVVDLPFVEQAALRRLVDAERVDRRRPQLVEARRRAVVADPLHDCGRGHQRVVGLVRHRAVAGCAANAQAAPGDTLLADVDRDVRLVLGTAVQAALLGQHVVGADRIGLVVGHPLHAVRAARLLVGDGEVDQVAAGAEPTGGEVAKGDRHRRGEVEHVDRAAAPDLAVDQLATERIARPSALVDRHDIGVAHQAQARSGRVAALDARRPARRARPWARTAGSRARSSRGTTAADRRCGSRSPTRPFRR